MKWNKTIVALTTALILLPIPMGLLLWSRLPDSIPTHFNVYGEPDKFSGKGFTVFAIPLILAAIHLLCIFFTSKDPRAQNTGKAMRRLIPWIVPAVTLFCFAMIYPRALGMPVDITFISLLFTGILFTVLGNYLPKCRQNSVIGIRIAWTLLDEDVWNHTHRLAGPLWVASGLVLIVEAFVRIAVPFVTGTAMVVSVFLPIVCSAYWYYQKKGADHPEP